MEAATKNRKSGFYIEVTCPGCGSPLELNEDFFVLECEHCGSVHRVVMPDVPSAYLVPAKIDKREARFSIDRYLKKNNLPLTASGMVLKQVYYPYWRVDAILFKLRNKAYERMISAETEYSDSVSVTHERTEINLTPYTATCAAGAYFDGVPSSMGLRTEYIRMLPYAEENLQDDFDSLPIVTTWEDVRADLNVKMGIISDVDPASFGSNVTELFHPKASLVYFPFLVFESYAHGGFNRYVVDGVSGRVLDHVTRLDTDKQADFPDEPDITFGALSVEHHRCPNCGFDLPARQSWVYICSNCQQLVVIGGNDAAVEQVFRASGSETPNDRAFPFWSFTIPEEDARRVKTMFGGVHHSDQLVIPAFQTRNFDAMYRLAKRISSALPQLNLKSVESFDNCYDPVTIGLDEALMLADVIIYRQSYSSPKRSTDRGAGFSPGEVRLIYVPFHPENYFYVDSLLNAVTFEKSLAR